jgi:hypothetical protein
MSECAGRHALDAKHFDKFLCKSDARLILISFPHLLFQLIELDIFSHPLVDKSPLNSTSAIGGHRHHNLYRASFRIQ